MPNIIMPNVYNHYMTTYSPRKTDARLDSHNRNELKSIYGKILKLNKEAPLYLYDKSASTTAFALALKENTRQLQYTILDSAGSNEDDLFKDKTAFSSNEDVLSAKYIGENTDIPEDSLSRYFQVHTLASNQVNVGNFLPAEEQSLLPNTYSLEVRVNNLPYEFELSVDSEDTNIDILSKLAQRINSSQIGLQASVIDGPNDTTALRIESLQTGEGNPPGTPLFVIESTSEASSAEFIDFLGLDDIVREGTNASFTVDGNEASASSNQFVLDNTFEITLNSISSVEDEPVLVGVKTNIDSLKNSIHNLISGYNSFLQAADYYKNIISSNKLSSEIQTVAKNYSNELDAVGINITSNGSLMVDEDLLTKTAESKEAYHLLSPLKDFSSSLFQKGEEISRDPLNYTNKKIVAYKNPGKNFTSPYATSSYSGLLFNYYC